MAHHQPYITTLGPGTYYWCSCGKSTNAPFCDGAHKGTGKEPVAFVVEKTEKVALCNCKRTRTPPFCDGAHAK